MFTGTVLRRVAATKSVRYALAPMTLFMASTGLALASTATGLTNSYVKVEELYPSLTEIADSTALVPVTSRFEFNDPFRDFPGLSFNFFDHSIVITYTGPTGVAAAPAFDGFDFIFTRAVPDSAKLEPLAGSAASISLFGNELLYSIGGTLLMHDSTRFIDLGFDPTIHTLIGSVVNFDYIYPTMDQTLATYGAGTVGNQVEFPPSNFEPSFSADVKATQIELDFLGPSEKFITQPFNGLRFDFTSVIPTGVTIDPSSTAFPDSYQIIGNQLYANYSAQTYPADSKTVFDFTFGAVPEPSVWMMFLVGFGFTGVAIRRQRAGSAELNYSPA